jgi:integrase
MVHTVATFAPLYLTHAAHELKPSTLKDYALVIASHVLPAIGGKLLAKLSTADALGLRGRLIDHPARANRAVNVLCSMLRCARQLGHKVGAVERPKPFREGRRSRYLAREEAGRLQATLDRRRDKGADIIRLLLFSGLRRGEVLNLRWSEVDEAHSMLRLSDTRLARVSARCPRTRSRSSCGSRASRPLVFPSEDGGPTRNVDRAWRTIRRKAGLEGACIHTLRHSFASFAVDAGIPIAAIGAALGHSSY